MDVSSALSEKQRQQLLLLRDIVSHALSIAKSALDNVTAEDKKMWPPGRVVLLPDHWWWASRPFYISASVAGVVLVILILIFILFCSPLYVVVCAKPERSEKEFKKTEINGNPQDKPIEGSVVKEFADATPFGQIVYLMRYDVHTEQLHVTVKNCSGLPFHGRYGLPDPYVVIRILNYAHSEKPPLESPEEDPPAICTSVVQNSLVPEFNFTGSFQITHEALQSVSVLFEVFDWSNDGKHLMIARHEHILQDPNEGHQVDDILSTKDGQEFSGKLKRGQRMPDTGPGEICVVLQSGSSEEEPILKVRIIECKGVYLRDHRGKVDRSTKPNTYVDVTLTEPHGRIQVKRTETVFNSRNPYFNEEFSFPIPPGRLAQGALRLTLVHLSDSMRATAIGTIEFSADVDDEESRSAREHWIAISEPQEKSHGLSRYSWQCLIPLEELARLRAARRQQAKRGLIERAKESSQSY